MRQWHDLLRVVLSEGSDRPDRTGTGRRSAFGLHKTFDLQDGFPAVTTKSLGFSQVKAELKCFLDAVETLDEFHDRGCTIWDANATRWRDGTVVGRHYGVQWRRWRTEGRADVDQLKEALRLVRHDPDSRRIVVTAWNPGELDDSCLPPCHTHFQLHPRTDGGLDMCVYMRSVDLFLGFPFDVASYALLLSLFCVEAGRLPGKLHFMLGDAHIYLDHMVQCCTVLSRQCGKLPTLLLQSGAGLDNFEPSMAELLNYAPQGAVKARMSP